MEISQTDVEHIAELARLGLTGEENRLYAGQLAGILSWAGELGTADTAGAAPTAHILGVDSALRPDTPAPFADTGAMLKNAPEREFDFIKVPKVIE